MEPEMENRLRFILETTNNWLKFAETKNAALLAAVTACTFGFLRAIAVQSSIWNEVRAAVYIGQFGLLTAMFICLTSFIPQIKRPHFHKKGETSPGDNLLFFGDIANYESRPYLEQLAKDCSDASAPAAWLNLRYADQIINNSRIALRKYKLFGIAIWLASMGLLVPVISAAVYQMVKAYQF